MDLGVWMSRAVWEHKHESDREVEAWNLPDLPDNFITAQGGDRLYVAIGGYWRGYFLLKSLCVNLKDRRAPFAISFLPASWTAIPPVPSPKRARGVRFTTEVPGRGRPPERHAVSLLLT